VTTTRKEVKTQISKIKTDSVRQWLEAQKNPYIKRVLLIRKFEERIAKDPNDGRAYTNIGAILHCAGNYELALQMFDRGISISPENVHGLMSRASLLATCPEANIRNGNQAVRDSEIAYRLAEDGGLLDGYSYIRRSYLKVLGASYAEVGDLGGALDALSRALDVCKTRKAEREVRSLIDTAKSGQPLLNEKGFIDWF